MLYYKRCIYLLTLFVLLLGLVGSLPTPVRAEQHAVSAVESGTPKCWSLDVILLVDQSYSMFSPWPLSAEKEDQKQPSDPDGYRFDAANEILDRLIQNRQDECPQAIHRFGLITFGDRPVSVLNMVQIDLTADQDAAEWSETYRSEIAAAAKDRTQQGTDPRKAFERAREMLQNASDLPTPDGYGLRRQVVILVTDGAPDGVGDVPSYMCSTIKELTSSDWSNTAIWGLALNASKPYLDNEGCEGSIRDDFKQITTDANKVRKGQFINLAYNRQAIPSFVSNVVSAEFGHPGIAISCGEVFYVDPYLEQAVFAFFRDKTDMMAPVTLSYLGEHPGEPLYQVTGGQVEINASAAEGMKLVSYKTKPGKEEITFSRPRPGAWRFEVSGLTVDECQSRIIASEEPMKPVVTLISPRPGVPVSVIEESPFRASDKSVAPIVIQLQAKDGTSIANENRFPLYITVDVALPAGNDSLPDGQKPQPIELSPAPGDLWTSDASVLSPYEGDYQLIFNGDTLYGNGNEGNHIFTEQFSYNVKRIITFGFAVETPKDNDRIACNQVVNSTVVPQSLSVRVAVKNDRGQTVDGKNYILSDLGEAFAATLLDKNGKPISQPVKLHPVSDQPGIFEAELPVGTAENLNCGETHLRVEFLGKYAVDQFSLPKNQQALTVTRVRSYGVQGNITGLEEEPSFPLHPTFLDACPGGQAASVPFDLEVRDLAGAILNPKDVAVSDPSALYEGKLIAPDGSFSQIKFEVVERAQGFVLSASVGSDKSLQGDYRVDIQPNSSAFKAEYVPSQQGIGVSFRREDSFITTPLACNLSIGIGSIFAALGLGLTIFGLTGGPGGTLEIIRSNEDGALVTLPLSRARWFSKAKNKALEELGIGRITYSKSKPWSDDHKRAVKLSVLSTEGEDVYENSIENDERQSFIGDFDIRYN